MIWLKNGRGGWGGGGGSKNEVCTLFPHAIISAEHSHLVSSYYSILPLKNYFIYYIIPFYNISNIPTFILQYNKLKLYKLYNKIINKLSISLISIPTSPSLSQQPNKQSPPRHHHAHHATTALCPPKSHKNQKPKKQKNKTKQNPPKTQ